jgi:hypothetical protein
MPQRQPTRIGNARPSQLMTVAGVGAVIDLPGMSVVVRGLDAWGGGGLAISEPRLLAQVQRALPGAGISSLRAAPYDAATANEPYTAIGVPVTMNRPGFDGGSVVWIAHATAGRARRA